jgi:hypothetical protein
MIAGAGFAQMSWHAANLRKYNGYIPRGMPDGLEPGHCERCDEYFRILDKAAEQWRIRGWYGTGATVIL